MWLDRAWALLWLLRLLRAAWAEEEHTCAYQVPRVDEVMLGVVQSADEEEGEEEAGEGSRRQRRALETPAGLEETYRQLRIRLHLDSSLDSLSAERRRFVKEELLPAAVGHWERALRVRRSQARIRLNRKCESSQYYLHPDAARQSCAGDCKNVTKCGEVPVPDQHLFQCKYCLDANPDSCGTRAPADGRGVGDADFLFYVSAVASPRCRNKDTVAYAAHCQQEALLDRPIAGHVNLCPSSVSEQLRDQEVLLSTVKHEILHALGFSAGLYAFYRDERGNPRTPRNEYGKPLRLNKARGYYEWSDATVRRVRRSDWWTRTGKMEHWVNVMVTPRVAREARAQLGCERLEGAELENQGLDGTALTHWEKRLFENEAMTGTHTQNPVYSRLTLALMEDSGWYQANFSLADPLAWGAGLGCDFALKSCGEWIYSRLQLGRDPHPFCTQVKGRASSTTTCTEARDSVALCNLVEYDSPLPRQYQNFMTLDGVSQTVSGRFGGSVELADYCPYNQEFEWKNDSLSVLKRDSRCEFHSNTPPGLNNAALEAYSPDARCLRHQGKWTQKKCGYTRTFQHYGAGCYDFHCAEGRLWIALLNGSSVYPCHRAGQRVRVRRLHQGWLHSGVLLCPACAALCPAPFRCLPDQAPPGPIGDPFLPEPCAAPSPNLPLPLLLLLLLLLPLLPPLRLGT